MIGRRGSALAAAVFLTTSVAMAQDMELRVHEVHLAVLLTDGLVLDECDDIRFEATVPSDRPRGARPDVAAQLGGEHQVVVPMERDCASVFPESAVLSSCSLHQTRGEGPEAIEMTIVARYYRRASALSAHRQAECESSHGEWHAVEVRP